MYAIVKKYSIYHGPCEVGDVVEVKEPNEHMVRIEASKWPEVNISTSGSNPALVCATDLPFPRRKPHTEAERFVVLYRSPRGSIQEFWSVTVKKDRATLSVLNANQAKKLFDKLPQQLTFRNYLFDPVAYLRQQEQLQQANADFRQSEKERLGDVKPTSKRGLSPGQSNDPHVLLNR